MQAPKTFFQSDGNCEPDYEAVRDLDRNLDARNFVESLWLKYYPYADSHFLSDARQHFQQRFWEMYLGGTLLERGFTLDVGGKKGPEFSTDISGHKCWFEAIAPNPGSGPDAVPARILDPSVVSSVPEDKIILRLRHAIREKDRKYRKYCNEDVVASDEAYVIAINSKLIREHGFPDSCDGIPFIVKAVLPFGNLAIEIDEQGQFGDSFYTYRDSITKQNEAKVSTNIFFDEDETYSGISAVLYSNASPISHPALCGDDFKLVHNPLATNPIPHGSLQLGCEYWVQNGELFKKNWNEDII